MIAKVATAVLVATLTTGCAINENKNDNAANVKGVTSGGLSGGTKVGAPSVSTTTPASLSPETSASSQRTADPAAGSGDTEYLDGLTPTLDATVSHIRPGNVQINAKTYAQSIRFRCESESVTYEVAGYKYLDAEIGVPDDSDGAGKSITLTFLKNGTSQIGSPVTATLGPPQQIHLDLQDSVQLEISCRGFTTSNNSGAYVDVAFGEAHLSKS